MVNIKIEKRENGTIASVLCQGHTSTQVSFALLTLMQACGHRLEAMKSGIIEINENEMYLISGIKQTKPAMAIADTLLDGLEYIVQKYPFNVQIQYLWKD